MGKVGADRSAALAVACRFRAELQQQMLREWCRVDTDVRLTSGVPLSWLSGPAPVITPGAFWQRWRGLAVQVGSGQPALRVSLQGL